MALFLGLLVSFVVAVDLVRWIRPDLLFSPDPSWVIPRLFLGIFAISVSAAAGGAAAAAFWVWGRTEGSRRPLDPLPVSRMLATAIGLGALLFGVAARLADLRGHPPVIWIDEILPLRPSLALQGSWSDFADAIRMLPMDQESHAFIGVLYLEVYRWALLLMGADLFTVRFMSALPGVLSLLTAALLGRALLPRGGGALTLAALAGMRWQLIIARLGWNGLALAPIGDLATLLLIRARRQLRLRWAAAGGVVAGFGAHVYLGAWILAAALGAYLLWPTAGGASPRRRLGLALVFTGGFLAAAAPLFLLRQNREASYFARASDQSLMKDIRRTRSWMPPFALVADAFQAPWLVPDPRQDVRKSRLGWILGVPLAVAFLRALRSPKGELSALIFCHAGAALAASLKWGLPGHPNGFRFVYLTTVTAVVCAAGVLWILGLLPLEARRPGALVAVGLLAVSAALGTRDLMDWGRSRRTFDQYWGESTLIGRAVLRWAPFGSIRLDPDLPHSPTVVGAVRDYRLDPEQMRRVVLPREPAHLSGAARCFRIVPAVRRLREGERAVEAIQDAWGRVHGVVLFTRCRL